MRIWPLVTSIELFTRTRAKTLWAIIAIALFGLSVASFVYGNALAAAQVDNPPIGLGGNPPYLWSPVVFADLGGLGAFLSALAAFVAIRVGRSSKNTGADDAQAEGDFGNGLNSYDYKFLSNITTLLAQKKLVAGDIDSLERLARAIRTENGTHPQIDQPKVRAEIVPILDSYSGRRRWTVGRKLSTWSYRILPIGRQVKNHGG